MKAQPYAQHLQDSALAKTPKSPKNPGTDDTLNSLTTEEEQEENPPVFSRLPLSSSRTAVRAKPPKLCEQKYECQAGGTQVFIRGIAARRTPRYSDEVEETLETSTMTGKPS
ncbi:hypothetical protein R1flu_004664 [Riccia fluitans]|uniref:Uncharacterized protein n=1 Tax=Riccia fluitans TaxID=41844 RepID=A0ABD1YQY3_9MARC